MVRRASPFLPQLTLQSDVSQASVKRKARKTGETSVALYTKAKKMKIVDKSARVRSKGKASTPARSPSRESSCQSDVKKKADPQVVKAIKEIRENFVHFVHFGATKSTTFVFPPGQIYKHGTDPKTVPVVPTAKMKEEMRGMWIP